MSLLHVLNLAALLTLTTILLLVAATNLAALVFLVPVFILFVLYWPLRRKQNIVACYFALSFSVLFWVIACAKVVTIDNLFGTQITRQLNLGLQLQSYVDAHLKESSRKAFRQPCCHDPLSYNLQPGSKYEETYDCPTCNAPYEVAVDETGYLNRQGDFLKNHDQLDLFIAGDSVIQSMGGPSVVEFLKERIPLTMWNLSLSGYGPRQKINALITYALPKHPRWLVVEFFSANDATDAIEDEVCESTQDFRCRFSLLEMRRRLQTHPRYSTLIEPARNPLAALSAYAGNSLTVAVTSQVIKAMTTVVQGSGPEKTNQPSAMSSGATSGRNSADMAHPAQLHVKLRREKTLLDWVKAGMTATQTQYAHLVAELREKREHPTVILLYNPSTYEIYRDIEAERNTQYDEAAQFQIDAQKSFAAKNGWIFLDLTLPLRETLKDSKTWIYGRYDSSHWSREGTTLVASVLTEALKKILNS